MNSLIRNEKEDAMNTFSESTFKQNEVQALRSAALADEPLSTRVLLAPWGNVASTNGAFVVDEESAALAMHAFEEHGTELQIDYEHQTLGGAYSSPNGQAPAAGWIKRISAEPGVGLFAEIEWTQQARGMLQEKQCRYLSPVAIIRKSDRKLVAIHSAALTNKPAIVGMTAIVNRDGGTEGLRDEGTQLGMLVALREELALPSDAGADEVLLAAGRRIAELSEAAKLRHVESRIGEALRQGKLVEAQRAWAEALVAREEGLFDEWLRTAPIIVQPGSLGRQSASAIDRRAESVAIRARAEFRSHAFLSALTTEEAYVADAVREARAA
jgi:phage I-like protein